MYNSRIAMKNNNKIITLCLRGSFLGHKDTKSLRNIVFCTIEKIEKRK